MRWVRFNQYCSGIQIPKSSRPSRRTHMTAMIISASLNCKDSGMYLSHTHTHTGAQSNKRDSKQPLPTSVRVTTVTDQYQLTHTVMPTSFNPAPIPALAQALAPVTLTRCSTTHPGHAVPGGNAGEVRKRKVFRQYPDSVGNSD